MKKKYIAPNVTITELMVSKMICVSNAILSTAEEDVIGNSDEFGSRRFGNIWDDDCDD